MGNGMTIQSGPTQNEIISTFCRVPAGLDREDVGVDHTDAQSRSYPGFDIGSIHRAVKQQHVGPIGITFAVAGCGPERFVRIREGTGLTGSG